MSIPVYNCIVEDSVNDITGIYAISFVDLPANEVDFVALNKEAPVLLNKDSKKQILTGVVLKPEQLIYRFSEQLGEYYIKFSAEQIEKIAQKMMKTGVALYNTTHQHESQLNGNYLTELWIVENPELDKSKALGFQNLPKGTLMCSYRIEDKNYWDAQVMTGNVKGFSLEGFFNQELNLTKIINSKSVNMKKRLKKESLLSRIGRFLLDIEAVESDDVTDSGETYVVFVLVDGKEVYVDKDGFATLNDEQCPAGEHKLANGNMLVVDDQGQFVETKEASTESEESDAAAAPQTLSKAARARLNKYAKEQKKARKQKLSDEGEEPSEGTDETVETLKAKIAEMQATINDLTAALNEATQIADEAKEAVEELKKTKPSSAPVAQKREGKSLTKMSTHQRIAHVASLGVRK